MATYMYVSVSGEDRIARFEVEPDTGRLEPRGDEAVSGGPYPLAVDPHRRHLYAGRVEARELTTYEIDSRTGRLSEIGSVALEEEPCFLSTDRTGRYLLSAYYHSGMVGVHPIGENGAAAGPPIEWLFTGLGAHSALTDRSNRFAYAPSIAGAFGPNLIFQFRFDESTGRLSPNTPPTLSPEGGAGPRHFCFNPHLDVVYFSNEQGCSVTAYGVDTSTGVLTPLQTVPTLPDGYEGDNSCSQIQITPSGRSLYAPNRGHDSVAVFSIDADTGLLTRTQIVETQPTPRALSLDPDGRHLYVAGEASGVIASYRVDPESGTLEPLELYDVGRMPMWVLIARVP